MKKIGKDKIKVMLVTTGYPRWEKDISHPYLHRLAKSLLDHDIEVHVIAPHTDGIPKEDIIDGVYVHRFQYLYPSKFESLAYFPGIPEKIKTISGILQVPFFIIAMILKSAQVIKKYNIDITYAHWVLPTGLAMIPIKVMYKKPLLLRIYGADIFPIIKLNNLKFPFNIFGKLGLLIIKYIFSISDRIIGNSDNTSVIGMRIGRRGVITIVDGVDTDRFKPLHNGCCKKIKEKYNIQDKELIIFSTGRMVERKGFKYLISALPILVSKIPNIKLILGGEGPEKENLKSLSHTLGISSKVLFPGFIPEDELPNLMGCSDVFVLPSIVDRKGDTEGLGLVLLEAMACETPVVGTNVGGIPSLIKDGFNGFIVPQKNTKKLALAILTILNNRKIHKKLGVNGRKFVNNKFSINAISKRHELLFRQYIR